jgi:hypothetical protein
VAPLTPPKGLFYGVVVLLVALLVVSSTAALYYYGENEQTGSQRQQYVGELGNALASYRSLSAKYNASLSDYNTTLSLLADAVANLNTSTPAYRNASLELSSLWNSYQQLASFSGRKALVYGVHMLVDFGNGTRRWLNDTSIQPGWNGYVASLVLLRGNLQAAWYPQYGEHLITSVGGVLQTSSTSWFFWEFSGGRWTLSATGADQLQIYNGTSIAWTLCGYDASFRPTCVP